MEESYTNIINESIKLELNVSKLYSLFSRSFPEDRKFWITLSQEEKNHARLLRLIQDKVRTNGEVIADFGFAPVSEIVDANQKLNGLLDIYSTSPPDRRTAFQMAYDIENSASEIHYQKAMDKQISTNSLLGLFQALNKEDKDHANRIQEYLMT